jgi:polyphenol oxidase
VTAATTSATPALEPFEEIADFADFGVRAFVTTRAAGSFSTSSDERVGEVMARWDRLREFAAAPRLATARQVHGARVITHRAGWMGWLRGDDADGHIAPARGTAMAVSIADCVPVFIAHPSGATAILHSGWKGTAARITEVALRTLEEAGVPARELRVHLGPAICGTCYEVSPDVYRQLTGQTIDHPAPVDLRALIANQARGLGVSDVRTSRYCTRCDNDRFFSHRAGDPGRQIAVIVAGAVKATHAGA